MSKILSLILVVLFSGGCAVNAVYDPLQSHSSQILLLNESALKQVSVGMTPEEVHNIMGESLIIGYSYQNPLPGEAPALTEPKTPSEKPLTIANPYRTAQVKTAKGECTAEYYVTSVRVPDGVVSDDELMPLVFCGGKLSFKGWDRLK
jgi:hypothetical protein